MLSLALCVNPARVTSHSFARNSHALCIELDRDQSLLVALCCVPPRLCVCRRP